MQENQKDTNNMIDDLKSNVLNVSGEALDKTLNRIVDDKLIQFVPTLIYRLKTTTDPITRNDIALALLDLDAKDSVDDIWSVVNLKKNRGYSGTLLYVLQNFDNSKHIVDLFKIAATGEYEESQIAFQILDDIEVFSTMDTEVVTTLLNNMKANDEISIETYDELIEIIKSS